MLGGRMALRMDSIPVQMSILGCCTVLRMGMLGGCMVGGCMVAGYMVGSCYMVDSIRIRMGTLGCCMVLRMDMLGGCMVLKMDSTRIQMGMNLNMAIQTE